MPPPRGLVQQVDHFLHRRQLLGRGQRLLVACSGGADSVGLLRLLHAVNGSEYWGWKLVVGHVDHQLRGRASAGDAAFVRQLAKRLGLAFVCLKVKVPRTPEGFASEAAARQSRYAALAALARRRKCAAIVVGHHAEDQAETILLKILRGCGLRGLAGMAQKTRAHGVPVVRPLLWVRRAELRAFLAEQAQKWREDASNRSPFYLRNRVRTEILPVLEGVQPRVVELLIRLAANARMAEGLLEPATQRALARAIVSKPRGAMVLNRVLLRKLPLELRRRVLRAALLACGVPADRIDFEQLLAATRHLRKGPGKKVQLVFGGGVAMWIEREAVVVGRRGEKKRRHGDAAARRHGGET